MEAATVGEGGLGVGVRFDSGFSDSNFGEGAWLVWVPVMEVFNELVRGELGGRKPGKLFVSTLIS